MEIQLDGISKGICPAIVYPLFFRMAAASIKAVPVSPGIINLDNLIPALVFIKTIRFFPLGRLRIKFNVISGKLNPCTGEISTMVDELSIGCTVEISVVAISYEQHGILFSKASSESHKAILREFPVPEK